MWTFDVFMSSHDLLRQGLTTPYWSRVVIGSATDDVDAHLQASQLAHTVHGDWMVTAVEMVDFPLA